LAAAQVLVDPALAFGGLLPHGVYPLPVGALPGAHGVGAAVENPADPVGQLVTVVGLGGDVVGGAGLGHRNREMRPPLGPPGPARHPRVGQLAQIQHNRRRNLGRSRSSIPMAAID
jgi:hypothetical protein